MTKNTSDLKILGCQIVAIAPHGTCNFCGYYVLLDIFSVNIEHLRLDRVHEDIRKEIYILPDFDIPNSHK